MRSASARASGRSASRLNSATQGRSTPLARPCGTRRRVADESACTRPSPELPQARFAIALASSSSLQVAVAARVQHPRQHVPEVVGRGQRQRVGEDARSPHRERLDCVAERVERGVHEWPVGERAQELAVEDRDLRLVAVPADDDDALLVRIVQDERVRDLAARAGRGGKRDRRRRRGRRLVPTGVARDRRLVAKQQRDRLGERERTASADADHHVAALGPGACPPPPRRRPRAGRAGRAAA